LYAVDKKKLLRDFAEAIAIPVGLTDSAKWPVRSGTVIFPVRNILVHEFLNQIEAAGLIGHPEKWRKAFDSSTQLWRMSHHLVNGLLDDGLDKGLVAEKILVLLEGIAALNNGHHFGKLGPHIILDDDPAAGRISVPMLNEKTQARKALMLSGLLWSYAEVNYFVAHELGCEYHGAYPIKGRKFAVIREFMNLKPVELWETRKYDDVPAYIRIITIHDTSLSVKFDVYNNLFDDQGSMASSLLEAAVLSDNSLLSVSEIEDCIKLFSEKVRCFADEVNAMDKHAVAHKYMDVFWRRKKTLTDYIGLSWKPSPELSSILDDGLIKGPKKAVKKTPTGRSPVEELAEEYDFSEYIS